MAAPKPASPNEPKPAPSSEASPTSLSSSSSAAGAGEAKAGAACNDSVEKAAAAAPAAPTATESDDEKNIDADTANGADAAAAAAEVEAEATKAAAAADAPAIPPSYFNTKSSPAYQHAKSLLKAGAFEDALSTIEHALQSTKSLLSTHDPTADVDLDQSLAPLHYLYGTTLLYEVEESADDDPMMQQQQQQEGAEGGEGRGGDRDDTAEDLQIAWENLELSRSILTRIISGSDYANAARSAAAAAAPSSSPAEAEAEAEEAQVENNESRAKVLDLAQIHLRLGDLQRANGRYEAALSDYARSLDLRTAALGPYDRRVADAHYRCGMTCLSLAAEGEKAMQDGAAEKEAIKTALLAAGGIDAAPDHHQRQRKYKPRDIVEFRTRSVEHCVQCGRTLGGLLAEMCGVDPKDVVAAEKKRSEEEEEEDDDDDDSADEEGSKGKGKAKVTAKPPPTTTESQTSPPSSSSSSITIKSSKILRQIRSKLSNLAPINPTADQDTFSDLRELLDEIQETVDNAEVDVEAIGDVSKMKADAEAEAEREDANALKAGIDASKKEAGGGTTTIGFGAPTMTTAATAAATTAGATAASASRPMMVIKKKKKVKPQLQQVQLKTDAPPPEAHKKEEGKGGGAGEEDEAGAAAEPDAKRQKTE